MDEQEFSECDPGNERDAGGCWARRAVVFPSSLPWMFIWLGSVLSCSWAGSVTTPFYSFALYHHAVITSNTTQFSVSDWPRARRPSFDPREGQGLLYSPLCSKQASYPVGTGNISLGLEPLELENVNHIYLTHGFISTIPPPLPRTSWCRVQTQRNFSFTIPKLTFFSGWRLKICVISDWMMLQHFVDLFW